MAENDRGDMRAEQETGTGVGRYLAAKSFCSTEVQISREFWPCEDIVGQMYARLFRRRKMDEWRRSREAVVSSRMIPVINFEGNIRAITESPFDRLEELRNEDEKVLEVISNIRSRPVIEYGQRLAARLDYLYKAAKEENPDETAISSESLKYFVGFLKSVTNLKYPDVVLSPSKNIRVQWRSAPNRHFAVEFLPTGIAHFVIFSPDPNYPERTVRLTGVASVDSLMEVVKPHGVLSWSSR